jgi:ABC-type glycerol-3-phosphate transport system substrate-binding protein
VVMWFSSQPVAVNDWAQSFEETFNQRNPDIQLSVEMHPSVSALRDKLVVAVAGGAAPDIFYEASNVMGRWIISGVATPIDRYLNAMPDRADLIPDVVKALRYDGKTWALPFSVWSHCDLYNMDLLENSGVARPGTWRELEASARRLLRVGEAGDIMVFGYRKPHGELTNFIDLQVAMEQLGSTPIATEGTKSNLQTEAARQALAYLRDMVQAGMPNSSGGSDFGAILGGRVAIQHMYPGWELTKLSGQISAAGVNLELHRFVGPEPGRSVVTHNAGTLFIVSSTGSPDQAWRVMQAFAERDALKGYLMAHGSSLSVRLSQRNDRDLLARPYYSSQIATLISPITTYGVNHPYYTDFRQPAGAFLLEAVNGEMAIETALEQAGEAIEVIIADRTRAAGK